MQGLGSLPCWESYREDPTRIQEQPAGAIVWPSFRCVKRTARKPAATSLSRVGQARELQTDRSARYSSTCSYDFHRSGPPRTDAAKERSGKRDQYRRERFRAAALKICQNVFARQTRWIGEVVW